MSEIGNRSASRSVEHVLDLPPGYDKRTKLVYFKPLRTIIVAHPDFPPCLIKDRKLVPLEPTYAPL